MLFSTRGKHFCGRNGVSSLGEAGSDTVNCKDVTSGEALGVQSVNAQTANDENTDGGPSIEAEKKNSRGSYDS